MKPLKNVLVALAFVFAFGAAYALDTAADPRGQHSTLGCISGIIEQPQTCLTTNSGPQCTVTVGQFPQPVEIGKLAYEGNNCGNPSFALKRP
ncbi:MAG: DUF6520 family protein [Cytophagales bacterium]|nr:DUF6520 family protein [Cytophagales bacterium]